MMELDVCPLEWRYGSQEMRYIFSRQNIINKFIEVEIAIMKGLEKSGLAPSGCWEKVSRVIGSIHAEEVYELEKKLGHDIAALVTIISERVGSPCGNYIHLGATSYDIVDTAWALILRDAIGLVKSKLRKVIQIMIEYTYKYRDVVMVGRTHGKHALPITFGFKMANYVYELSRSFERLTDAEKRVVRGKIAGAVGTMAGWFGKGLIVEKEALSSLNLEPHAIATQIAPRDGFAELVSVLAILGSQLDRFALEIRELMRDEIAEVFYSTGEVGSSAMPHKRNPSTAERICGLAKVLRGLVLTAMENIPLMHERDLTNSSSERILIPHIFLLIDQMLEDTISMLLKLNIDVVNMRRNLELTKGNIMSECITSKLVIKGGIPRLQAYDIMRKLSRESFEKNMHLRDIIASSDIAKVLDINDIEECFDYTKYLGNYRELIARAIDYANSIIGRAHG